MDQLRALFAGWIGSGFFESAAHEHARCANLLNYFLFMRGNSRLGFISIFAVQIFQRGGEASDAAFDLFFGYRRIAENEPAAAGRRR